MGIIYKIVNTKNNKVYIGLTNNTLNERWRAHKAQSFFGNTKHLYSAMRKYGVKNFAIEQIDESDDFKILGEKERYWINYYSSYKPDKGYNLTRGGESNQLDANPRAKLCVEDIIQIRKIYNECKLGVKSAWELYKDKISYSAFEKIYEGITWKNICPEVYTEENKIKHNTIMKAMKGCKNAISKTSDEEIMEMRKYYVTHTLKETFEKYGKNFKNIDSFRSAINYGYKHLPIYHKSLKKWSNE